MKQLYRFIGRIKKTNEVTEIYCIATNLENAINTCSEFATCLDWQGPARDLGWGWN
jgi:hypothetical protein